MRSGRVMSGVRSGAVMSSDVISEVRRGVRSGAVMSWDVISCDEL